MVCPYCFKTKTQVINSRKAKKSNATWRRRECLHCNKKFTTTETIDPASVLRVEGKPFAHTTLLISLLQACDHRKDQETAAAYLHNTILQKLYQAAALTKQQLTKKDIIACVLETLARYDVAAHIKYLSRYSPYLDAKSLKKLRATS